MQNINDDVIRVGNILPVFISFWKKKYYIYILTRAGVIFKYKILCK